MSEIILQAKNLCKTYPGGDKPALDNVSVDVHDKEFLAMVGQSGSGKSTLLSVLSSLSLPDSGAILFGGEDITKSRESTRNRLRAQDFAFIFQQHHLLPYLTVLENVLLPFMNRRARLGADLKAKGKAVLEHVGLSHKVDVRPGKLSGGEQQRVAIARALARNARLLFADEPTGSLDSATGATIMELLSDLNRQGLTIIMVTHNNAYAALAHRTISMKDGLVVDAL